jgi:preprotein translocase subunit SecF
MFNLIPVGTKIDFIGKQKIWITISLSAFILSLVLIFGKGFNYGIDFTGGAVIQVKFKDTVDPADLRKWLSSQSVDFSIIQQIGAASENEFQLKLQGDVQDLAKLSANVAAAIEKSTGPGKFEVRKTDVVGPQAGAELRWASFWATVYAIIGIVIYVIIRFDVRYSPGALASLLHDATIMLGAIVITQKEFSIQIVAAVLTIIGYSINDTIIVYDRIREVIKANPTKSLKDSVNEAINTTLTRTINTNATVLLSVFALWLFGGQVIQDFSESMLVGMIVGTYSSIFVASPLFVFMAKRQERLELAQRTA